MGAKMEKKMDMKAIIDKMEKCFLYLFMLYAILSSNNLTYGAKVISFVMWPAFLLGFVIVLYRLVNFKNYFYTPSVVGLVALICSVAVSTLTNYGTSLKNNLVFCVYWVFYFAVIYVMGKNKTREEQRKNIEICSLIFVSYTLISTVISLIMMFEGVSATFKAEDTGYVYYMGFAIGRLWGTYINPNNGATAAAVSIMILIYFFKKYQSRFLRIACVLVSFLYIFFIALSDSRTGAVSMGVSLGFGTLFVLLYYCRTKTNLIKAGAVLMAVIVLVVGFFIPRKTKTVYNNIAAKVDSIIYENREQNDDTTEDDKGHTLKPVDRGYDMSGDISNRRFDAWASAMEIYVSSPKSFLIGHSFGGFADYAETNLPDTYIVNNDYADFSTLDNEFFNIMVSQGTIGLLGLLIFIVSVVVLFVKKLLQTSKEDIPLVCMLFSIVAGLASAALFAGVMFYHFSPNAVLFWFALGYLVMILSSNNDLQLDRRVYHEN